MANPTKIQWTGPSTYTNGNPFGQADHGGYEISVNGAPAVAIPVAWQSNNEYEFDLAALNLGVGSYSVTLRTVAANGQRSVPTNPVTFQIVDERIPNPPTNLRVV